MVKEVAADVMDPQKGVSVAERLGARDLLNGGDGNPGLYALGSGSDYTPFIQHAGIAALILDLEEKIREENTIPFTILMSITNDSRIRTWLMELRWRKQRDA